METHSGHPLGDDILDRVLTFLPDFSSLQATILSSKAAYTVFAAHPHSIVRAVAQNLLGPAILSAIHLIRNVPPEASYADPYTFGHAPPEPTEVGLITPEDARKLSRNAGVVHAFRDIYSFRHKDRSCPKSNQLTAVESLRFTRALYRIMLFADVFPGSHTPDLDGNIEPEDEAAQHAARKAFFTPFPSQDLLEIGTVGNFMEGLGEWVKRKVWSPERSKNHPGQAKAVPPALFLQAYRELDPQLIDDYFDCVRLWEANELLDAYIHGPLCAVLRERGELPRPWGKPVYSKYVLDYVEGQDDLCQRCGANDGIELWTESNWDLQNEVTLTFRPVDLQRLRLPGRLNDNPRERNAWAAHIKDDVVSLPAFLHEVFELRTKDYASLSPRGRTCTKCLMMLVESHTYLWLLRRKRLAGESIPEDCSAGYQCRAMLSDREHAAEFNHLCAPGPSFGSKSPLLDYMVYGR
ncbi:hypothetical protein C8R46DRAFT_1360100 [Mycena filopes]|nr:hypothetical protein C8R46DRAFT_1360100 [Mycena filopes]